MAGWSTLTTSIQYYSRSVKQGKEVKEKWIGKEDIQTTMFVNKMVKWNLLIYLDEIY